MQIIVRTLCLILIFCGAGGQYFNDPYVKKPQYPYQPQWPDPDPADAVPNTVETFDYPVRPIAIPEEPPSTNFRYDVATNTPNNRLTPFYGGVIDSVITLEKIKSPYLVREDVIIARSGVLNVEPGVVVRFAPMVGITVHGIINVKVRTSSRVCHDYEFPVSPYLMN